MLKEIIVLALIVAAVFVGYQFYANNWDAQETISSIQNMVMPDGATNTDTIVGAISGIAGAGTIANLAYSKLKSSASEEINKQNNVIVDKNTELQAYKATAEAEKEQLLAEIQQLKDETPDTTILQDQVTQLQSELDKSRTTIDTLHETLKRNKLTDGEEIIKTVVL